MSRVRHLLARDQNFTILVALTLAVYVVLVPTLGGRFLSEANLQSMATQVAEFGLLAIAMGLAMLTGGIDLSVVSAAVLSAVVGSMFLRGDFITITETNHGMVIAVAVVAALATGMLTGLVNGTLIAKFSVPPILGTLGTYIMFSGISTVVTEARAVSVAVPEYPRIAIQTVADVPLIFVIMVLVYVAVAFFLRRTRTGRRIYLYGENNVALRFTGARNERLLITTYVIIGLIAGLAGLIISSRANGVKVGYGDTYLLQAILVVVLAGFDPYGGRGRVGSLFVGLVMLQSLQSAFTIMQFNPFMKKFIWGAMLLAVMVVNHVVNRRAAARTLASGAHAPSADAGTKAEREPAGVTA
jgi:simple sugar transport system permease protein